MGWITAKLPRKAKGLIITDGSASRSAASAAQTSSADIRQRLANAPGSDEGDVIHQVGDSAHRAGLCGTGGATPAFVHAGRGTIEQTR